MVNFPRSCLHCAEPACVSVCPTGASYKRASDGIVLVDPETCIGCKLCSWVCPYGAREYDYIQGVMEKCTLCVDRIYDENLEVNDRALACVRACLTGARHFGDLGDEASAVAQLVKARGGLIFFLKWATGPPINICRHARAGKPMHPALPLWLKAIARLWKSFSLRKTGF